MARIFVADDNPHVHRMVEETLGPDGHEVAGVLDGAAALERLASAKPDLALLDTTLPGISGYEVCDAILARSELNGMRVVMLLGPLEPVQDGDETPPGVHAVVQKPLDAAILRELANGLPQAAPAAEEPSPAESEQQVIDGLLSEALGRSDPGPSREAIREQIEAALTASMPLIVDRIADRLVARLKES